MKLHEYIHEYLLISFKIWNYFITSYAYDRTYMVICIYISELYTYIYIQFYHWPLWSSECSHQEECICLMQLDVYWFCHIIHGLHSGRVTGLLLHLYHFNLLKSIQYTAVKSDVYDTSNTEFTRRTWQHAACIQQHVVITNIFEA